MLPKRYLCRSLANQRSMSCRNCSTPTTPSYWAPGHALSAFLRAVADTGAEFGMSLHVGKTQLLKIRSPGIVTTPNDENLASKPSMIYLGGLLSDDGRSEKELSRRLGLAASDFKKLSRIWSHSNVSSRRKLHIFKSCVISVLMYGLKTMWLGTASRRRLDGFQARCIRRILRIPAAYISRISNAIVRDKANSTLLSNELLQQQLLLFGDIAARDAGTLRDCVFAPGSVSLAEAQGCRGRGRPRHTWADQVRKHTLTVTGSEERLMEILMNRRLEEWRTLMSEHTTART